MTVMAYSVKLIVDAVDVVDNGETRRLGLGQERIGAKVVCTDPHAVHSLRIGNVEDRLAVVGERLVSKESRDLVALNIREWCVNLLQVTADLFVGTDGSGHSIVVKIGSGIVRNIARPDTSAGGC